MSMPKYKCHKVVQAFQIEAISQVIKDPGRWGLSSGSKDNLRIHVSPEYMEKHKPKVGGYYVRYADGYESWSPADAFEDGYTLIPEDK